MNFLNVYDEIFFRRGDVSGDGSTNIADALLILSHLFVGEPSRLPCAKSADLDADDTIALVDSLNLLDHLFIGSFVPAEPFRTCGPDSRQESRLTCQRFELCD